MFSKTELTLPTESDTYRITTCEILESVSAVYSQAQVAWYFANCEYLFIIYLKWNSVIFLGVPLVSLHHSFSQLCSFLKASCHSVVAEILAPAHFDVTLNDFFSYVFDNFLKIKWEKCSRCYYQGSSSRFRI